MMFPLNTIICGDAVKVLKKLPDECVDMVLTSPPYWNLRNYGVECQMGLEKSPQEYIERIASAFAEVKRVLKKTGSLYINLGDTYCNSHSGSGWLRPKQLLLLPPRIAIAMQEKGWLLRNVIIWHKPNSMPSSVKDRLTNTWEYLFFFVKSPRYYFDLDAIRVPHKTGPAKFNYRVREAKRGDKMIIGVHAKPEEMARYNSKGVMVSEKRRKTANEGYKASGMRNAPEPSEPNAFHPAGKNPGDVMTKHDLAVGRTGNLSYSDPLHVCAYSVGGKNPGDTIRTDLRARMAREQNLHTFYSHSRRGDHLNNPKGKNPGDTLHVGADTRRKSRGVAEARSNGTWGDDHPSRNPGRWFSADGKNPGEFWTIKTRPFKGAHFAVFPEDLCITPIEAGCPRWVCNKCGKARTRITRPTKEYAHLLNRSWTGDTDKDKDLRMKIGFRAHTKQTACTAQYETVGWSDCGCNAGFKPGIVLDPFAGSGTVGVVAKRFGRKFILIDINPAYCALARKRLRTAA
jgi:DNA modification methylase